MREVTKQNLSIIIIAFLWAGIFFLFINYLRPLWLEIDKQKLEITKKNEEIKLLGKYRSKVEDLIRFYDTARDKIEQLNNILPDKSQPAQILAILSYVSRINNITLGSLDFNFQEGENLGIVEVNFNLSGGNYEDFKKWLTAIEKELRIMDIKEITLKTKFLGPIQRGRIIKREESMMFDYQIKLYAYYQPIIKITQ